MASRNERINTPKVNQKTRDKSNAGKSADPPKVTVPWGRSASGYRPGLFIRQYFGKHKETCAADIYRALSDEIEHMNNERIAIGEKPFRRPNYSSFNRYMHWFAILKLIDRTDKREPAIYDFLQKRVFYRLTSKGRVEVKAWEDPIAVTHPEFR
jgi:hypothetical protein